MIIFVKIKFRITIIILLFITIFLILSNIGFRVFFQNYLQDQEKEQIRIIGQNISNYLNVVESKNFSVLKDWSSWDDTYNFINNDYPEYVDVNLVESTFTNLDVNFIILLGKIITSYIDDTLILRIKNSYRFQLTLVKILKIIIAFLKTRRAHLIY